MIALVFCGESGRKKNHRLDKISRAKMFSASEIYGLAIRIEKNGEAFYREALKKFSSPSISSLLEYLADEEVRHVETFTKEKRKIDVSKDYPIPDENISEELEKILGDQKFSLAEVDLSKIRSLPELLQIAEEFEEDTILFFQMIASFIEDRNTLNEVEKIITEEKEHIKLLRQFAQKEEEKG